LVVVVVAQVWLALLSVSVCQAQQTCFLPTGFAGKCTTSLACAGDGVWTATGTCPGTDR
jgi:hypothetical protein